jgi:hypothetical protein
MKKFILLGIIWLCAISGALANGYRYSYIPKKVYQNQIFPITITSDEKSSAIPQFDFDTIGTIAPLNQKPLILRNSNEIFYSFYFKAPNEELQIPRIFIKSSKQKYMLEPKYIKVKKLEAPKNFCGVIATDFKITSYQISKYDNNNYLVTLSIKALEANLEDMHITNVEEYGLDKLKSKYPKITSEFYFIIDSNKKFITFTYYNSIKVEFIPITLKLNLNNNKLTTQSDLNPKNDSFYLLKKYLLMFLTALFLLMFIFKKDFFYLIFGVLSFITLLTLFVPQKSICIKANSKLYILPTYTSRVSSVIKNEYTTKVLEIHNNYNKIEYKNHTIGWIKDEDVCKD